MPHNEKESPPHDVEEAPASDGENYIPAKADNIDGGEIVKKLEIPFVPVDDFAALNLVVGFPEPSWSQMPAWEMPPAFSQPTPWIFLCHRSQFEGPVRPGSAHWVV